MLEGLALSIAFAALTSGGASPAILPVGTHHYGIYDDGKRGGTSTIVVTRDKGSLRLTETMAFKDESAPMQTTRMLDPETFTTLRYAVGGPGAHESVDVAPESATYHNGTSDTRLEAATAGPSAVGDYLVGVYVALPAMIHATTASAFSMYCICFGGFQVKSNVLVKATAARPAGAPAGDASLAFRSDDETVTLWYDPVSFVLHEMDVPDARIKIVEDRTP